MPTKSSANDLCKYNTDSLVPMTRRMLKYFKENPMCKDAPVHEGYCEKHIPFLMRRERDWANTPHEARQLYLDEINKGKTIGEAREIAGITLDVALEVTNRAIGNYHYLKKEAE